MGAMETATSGGALGRGRRGGGTASRGGRGLHGGASGSGPPSSPPPPPPPASPAGARGCRAGRPAASNAHTSPGERRVGQTTGGCGEPPPEYPRGWLWVSASGTRPRPGNQVESHPSQEDCPFLRSSRAASPHRRPSGWAGAGGRGGVVLGTPEVGSGSTPGPVSGAGSQAAAWRAPPPGGPGAPLTRPDSTQLVSMTRVWLCCSQTRRQKSPTVCGRGPWAAMNSRELQRPWREAGGSGPPCPQPLPSAAPEPRLTPALRG